MIIKHLSVFVKKSSKDGAFYRQGRVVFILFVFVSHLREYLSKSSKDGAYYRHSRVVIGDCHSTRLALLHVTGGTKMKEITSKQHKQQKHLLFFTNAGQNAANDLSAEFVKGIYR